MKTYKRILASLILILFSLTTVQAEIVYYDTDNVGTPVAMWDENGKKVWEGEYFPFGEEYRISELSQKNDKRFVGKEKDKETGLTYFGARYMDEKTGRFITPDPVRPVDPFTSKTNRELLENPQRLNRYAYGLNNPYKYVDPDGEFAVIVAFAVGAWALDAMMPQSTDVKNSKGFLDYADNATMFAGVGSIRNVTKIAKAPIWSSTKFKSAVQNAFSHFKKHGNEFPDLQNAKQYVDAAKSFLTKPPKGTLSHTRANGDVLRYNPNSNTFGVLRADGAPRTMFKPKDGIKYWRKQTKKVKK